MPIQLLDEQTINQIAAGEVIESPASVVKELVENSIDAGANEIVVEIKEGGRQLIRVRDSGSGIKNDEVSLAFQRHATSKICSLDDIYQTNTMGFRGEALPSIASVAKVALTTRCANEAKGTFLSIEGGKAHPLSSVDCEEGTIFEVRDLFFNVPVRKKFQKAPTYDANAVLKVMTRLALAHPTVAFQLFHEGKQLLKSSGSGELERCVKEVLSPGFLEEMVPLDFTEGAWRVEGFVGSPSVTRPNRTGQYLFVNRRGILSLPLSDAVKEGFGTAIATQRHPVFVLFLKMEGSAVDVNVHPQKLQVRFQEEQRLREAVSTAVEQGLGQQFHREEPRELFSVAEEVSPFFSLKPPPSFTSGSLPAIEERHEIVEEPSFLEAAPPPFRVWFTFPRYSILSGEKRGALFCLVDQKRAAARILYERLCTEEKEKERSWQSLAVPHVVELLPEEVDLISSHQELLKQMGLQVRASAKDRVVIDAQTALFARADVQEVVKVVASGLATGLEAEKEKKKQLAWLASHTPLQYRGRLSLTEAQQLVDQLLQCNSPYFCPYGKSTLVDFSEEKLKKLFS